MPSRQTEILQGRKPSVAQDGSDSRAKSLKEESGGQGSRDREEWQAAWSMLSAVSQESVTELN